MWPHDQNSSVRGFCTPQPAWNKTRSAVMPNSERKWISPANKGGGDIFHVIHKVPVGDSPYGKAKHVQLIDKDPSRAISLFWAAINASDRVDSALKDMAIVMKQLDRSDEAIEAIKSFRHLCSYEAQESLDNVLIELYKRSGRIDEEIEMLQNKLKNIEDGIAFGGKRTKTARSQGKKVQISIEQEKSRILGNLAWAFLQQHNYGIAEQHYSKALSLEPDRNKQCNLAICLLHMKRVAEAKALLKEIKDSCRTKQMDESYAKSYKRAFEMLGELESLSVPEPVSQEPDKRKEFQSLHAYKRTYSSPPSGTRNSEVLLTQPRRGFQGFNSEDHRRGGGWGENAARSSVRKLQFDQSDNATLHSTQNLNENPGIRQQKCAVPLPSSTREDWRRSWRDVAKVRDDKVVEYPRQHLKAEGNDRSFQVEKQEKGEESGVLTQPRNILLRPQNEDGRRARCEEDAAGSLIQNLSFGQIRTNVLSQPSKILGVKQMVSTNEESETGMGKSGNNSSKKSWADLVEEEEEEMLSGKSDVLKCEEKFNDENLNSNIVYQKPFSQEQIEIVQDKLGSLDLKGAKSAAGDAISSRRNRLQVFRDITP